MRVVRVTLLLLALLALAAVQLAAAARHDEHAALQAQLDEPPQRDTELMRAQLGMVELDAEAESEVEDESALMELDAASESASATEAEQSIVASSESRSSTPNFLLDDSDSERVFVEAASAADEQMAAGAAAATEAANANAAAASSESSSVLSGPPPVPTLGAEASGPASSVSEMLPTRVAPPAGQLAPASSFVDAPQSSARPERSRVVQRRLDRAQYGLAKKAWKEHVAEYDAYRHKLHAWQWTRAVAESRQAPQFQRPLHTQPAVPAASSHAAAMGGDRNHNRLFPAATLASDGKASSQNDDFQHRGFGDQFAQPILVEALTEALTLTEQTPDAAAPTDAAAAAPVDAAAVAPADAAAAAPADAAAAAPVDPAAAAAAPVDPAAAAPVAMDASAAGAAAPADFAAAGTLAPAATSADGSSNSAFVPYAADKPAFVPPPNLANQPCYDQCNAPGAWVSAACQDCIVRGMVNGWIVRSLVDQQKGYNYAHYARNKCVAYVNELQAKGGEVKGAPFAHCFFQRMHETCNL